MVVCPICKKELPDDAKFCAGCGTSLYKTIFCTSCGAKASTQFDICQNCGAILKKPDMPKEPATEPANEPAPVPSAEPVAEVAPAPVVEETPVVPATEPTVVVEPTPVVPVPSIEPAPVPTENIYSQAAAPVMQQSPYQPTAVPVKKAKKPFPKKLIIFGAIGLTLVIIATILLSVFIKQPAKSQSSYALYVKDNELFFNSLKGNSESWQLSDHLIDTDEDFDEEDIIDSSYSFSYAAKMSPDGKTMFFPDKIDGEGYGYNLYYRDTTNQESEPVKVASNVAGYIISDSGKLVIYATYISESNYYDIYEYNMSEDSKDKIASDVRRYNVSSDGKTVCYINDEDKLYIKESGKDKEKISSDVTGLYWTDDESLKSFYYVKEDALYKYKNGDSKKLVSDVYGVIEIYDSDKIYFSRKEAEEVSLMDYVNDDMKDVDAYITQPEYPEYPSYSDYYYYSDYYAAVERYYDEYDEYLADYEKYREKLSRDNLRESLSEATLDREYYSLYYFDGKNEVLISDACASSYPTTATEAPVVFYRAYNQSNVEKINLSEIQYTYEVEDYVEAALFSSYEAYIASESEAKIIEQESYAYLKIAPSGEAVYFMDNLSGDDETHGDLYCVSIDDGNIGDPELYDTDVYGTYVTLTEDETPIYFKDVDDYEGEMYVGKKRIDYDVYCYVNITFDKIYYRTDVDDDSFMLKMYDSETVKIADDVYNYKILPDGRVLYLYDYSTNRYKGELYEWDDGEARKLDDDVVMIVSIQ